VEELLQQQEEFRKSGSFEASVQSPVDVLRTAGISGAFETDSRKSSKRFAVGMEYNGRQASMEGRLSGLSARNAFVKGSWNNQAITLNTFYQNDFKMADNVTTPFQGYQNWVGRFERTKKDLQCQATLHLMTPFPALPSIDIIVQTLLEAGKRPESAAFQRLQFIFQNYAGRLESVVMQQVDEIRTQLIEMANSYAEIFRPYTQYFDAWAERARLFYFETLANLNGKSNSIQFH
jgi:hypothetical protein